MKAQVTVVIPTYNSANKLRYTLNSIHQQITNLAVEIMIVDGGSTDQTVAIATDFKAKVVNNPHRHPEWAKLIGAHHANGQILIFLDSDESFSSRNAIEKRWNQLQDDSVAVAMSGGYQLKNDSTLLQHYMNAFSDPFSFYMYGISTDSELIHKYYEAKFPASIGLDATYCVLSKSNNLPMLDLSGGTAIRKTDANRFLVHITDIPRFLSYAVRKRNKIAILRHDSVVHHLSTDMSGYINKINWRIINNLFHASQAGAGFVNREATARRGQMLKAVLFIPFALLVIPALIQAIPISWQKQRPLFIYHVALSLYTALAIVYFTLLKVMKRAVVLPTYGERDR